ncbi:fasciclin-like arabinogalactan protein 11 [Canna indica]|uniref:Fasciclin-like arabinogalactan protein 11 n=1 Tax=Canna indica TaxID=4628 RepID=A0AAQ3L083_9LILI|nr:fasciclin-like arabinogalactan protein 11 [Canna indica]
MFSMQKCTGGKALLIRRLRSPYTLLQSKVQTMKRFATCAIALLFLAQLTSETFAQSAISPAPAGPKNVTAILEKAGQFGTLIRLLRSTQVGDQINNQMNNSNSGLTIFAPTDNAFSSLPSGTLNSLSDQEKVALIQFHVLPSAIPISQFETVSNPVRTQAGDATNGRYPLNVTTSGSQVNITTGVVNTTIANTLFSDSQLVVYQVDKVLLPLQLFGPAPPPSSAPAPEPAKPGKSKPATIADGPSSPSSDSTDTSTAINLNWSTSGVMAFAAAAISLWWSF